MKAVLALLAVLVSFKAQAAFFNYDGCYQLYTSGAVASVVCLDGVGEEGINGAGIRLFVFKPNSTILAYCAKSTGSVLKSNEFQFIKNGNAELVLTNVSKTPNGLIGDAVVGSSKLKFGQVGEKNTARFMEIGYKTCPRK